MKLVNEYGEIFKFGKFPLIEGVKLVETDCVYTLFFDKRTLTWKVKNNQTPFVVDLLDFHQYGITDGRIILPEVTK